MNKVKINLKEDYYDTLFKKPINSLVREVVKKRYKAHEPYFQKEDTKYIDSKIEKAVKELESVIRPILLKI